MDVASRPSLELLPDLPVEEPLDGAAAAREPPTVPAAPAAAAVPGSKKDPEQTDLHFIDPELFMTPDQAAAVTLPPASPPPAPRGAPESELALEDPLIDEMLTTPPPPPARIPAPPTLSAAPAPKPATEAPPRSTRVPIAKTASLSTAAAKVAAASAAQQRPMKSQGITPPPVLTPSRAAAPATAKPQASGARVEEARNNGSKDGAAKTLVKPGASGAEAAGSKSAAGLAGWASARSAATAPSTKPAPVKTPASAAESVRAAAGAAPIARSAAPKTAAALPIQPEPASSPASPPMDRDFIARNQVVERYLSGRLPLKGATDFERYCHAHPEILDEIGLPERVNAGLRLLEASGKPEPWQEAPRPLWHKPQVTLSLAAAVIVLGVALAAVGAGSAVKNQRIATLQKQAFERALDPATSTREIRLLPSREGASNSPAITIGGRSAQLADFKIDETRSPYHAFRVTVDRIDQGRVGVITNLTKDTNGHLRIALNSSALGPGNYQLTIEGLNWRGEPEPDSWVTIGILR
jgi:hypothetical protein